MKQPESQYFARHIKCETGKTSAWRISRLISCRHSHRELVHGPRRRRADEAGPLPRERGQERRGRAPLHQGGVPTLLPHPARLKPVYILWNINRFWTGLREEWMKDAGLRFIWLPTSGFLVQISRGNNEITGISTGKIWGNPNFRFENTSSEEKNPRPINYDRMNRRKKNWK